jgi:serine phosphatase RsbU (regulator of sigma subunit)
MSLLQEHIQTNEQRTLPNAQEVRLHGRWLVLARVVWIVIALLALGLIIASIPSYFTSLHVLCMGALAPCSNNEQLSPNDLRALQALGLSLDFFATYQVALVIVFAAGYAAIGAVLFWRRSNGRMALFASLTLVTFPAAYNRDVLATLPSAWWLPGQFVIFLGNISLFLFFYLFPTGRFVPRWTGFLWVGVIVFWAVNGFFLILQSSMLAAGVFVGLVCSIPVAQIYRYRRVSNAGQRQQTKWVVFGISTGLGGFLALKICSLFLPSLVTQGPLANLIMNTALCLFFLLVPLSIGFAVLRYRLWDIDVLINRTLIYGTLTVVLALVYFSCVVLLQQLFQAVTGQGSAVAIVGSTLGMVVLFRPLRHQLQLVIDRHLYRRTYDAAQTLAAFGARLQQRDEVDLATLSDDLLAVVQATMQPTHVLLWLRPPAPEAEPSRIPTTRAVPEWQRESSSVVIAPTDPLVAFLLSASAAVNIERLHLDSPALLALQAAGMRLAVPLISQGELVGLLQLGSRKSDQDYSSDDRGLLHRLAIQAAPAIRVAQLVREQQAQARERERLAQELQIARQIQQEFLPKDLPALPGWQMAAHYQPARAVGGDFYDFLSFEDGRLGIVIGDVTDKGIPAALLMTTTRTILRSVAQREASPGKILEQTNALLCPEMPPNMFVTCLYAILDPANGRLCYANAGHDQPYQRRKDRVGELWATGMPLGLMPGMTYEEKETIVSYGDSVLWYSDGLVEAHNPEHVMFGFPRLANLLEEQRDNPALIELLLLQLAAFTGHEWEQEDDITLVTLQRSQGYEGSEIGS